MEQIKNLSVRKTIILYLSVSLVCSFLLSAVIVKTASRTQKELWWKYVDQEKYFKAAGSTGDSRYLPEVSRPDSSVMTRTDHAISEFCDFLETYTVLILSVMGSCVSVLLFYKHKLKEPLEELKMASGRIAQNDLDFQMTYESRDEMGRLCQEFERMRVQLAQNNRKLWRMVEDERQLRAAIAHDIRSPLSVLKGYQEMLIDYLPDGTIDVPKAVEMLAESMKQIERMDRFVETMRKMNSLAQRSLLSGEITAEALKKEIQAELAVLGKDAGQAETAVPGKDAGQAETAVPGKDAGQAETAVPGKDAGQAETAVFGKDTGKQVILNVPDTAEIFLGDREVILEVMENLLSNALRYARNRIEVNVCVTCRELKICVEDDGRGFCEDAETVTKAFHQQNAKDSLNHAGMGMYISRLYCEKHGGNLLLENKHTGGAAVTAVFRRHS